MTSAGIASYGVYVPRYRMKRQVISQAIGWLNSGGSGERAVANYDEDSLTMAVAAAQGCLNGQSTKDVDGVYFASSTFPYRERESVAVLNTALELRENIRAADFANSMKGWTTALLAATDAVKAGSAKNVLVCGSDIRSVRPGSNLEKMVGDGAAAVLLSGDKLIATLEGYNSVSVDFPDYRRSERDEFTRAVEDRFIREEGYSRFIPLAVGGLLKKYNLQPSQVAKVAFPCLAAREHGAIAKKIGFSPEQVQEPLLNKIGEAGVAGPALLLAAMLDDAKPGDYLIVASYGNGADAILFKVTDAIAGYPRPVLKRALDSRLELSHYEKYLNFRGVVPFEIGIGDDVALTELPLTWRERATILALKGTKCTACGTPQYPPQRICVNPACGAVDKMERYDFAHQSAKLFSFTIDQTASTPNPPLIYGMLDFTGGGRFVFELTDCEPNEVKTGMPVQMSFRKKYTDNLRGIHGYFWKAVPAR